MSKHIVRLGSLEHGQEDFEYDSLEEAQEGLERLKESCLEEYRKDGVSRILVLMEKQEGLTVEVRTGAIAQRDYWDTESLCPSTGAEHTPDWTSVFTEWDGDEEYLDIRCVDCGKRGSLGTKERVTAGITW